MRLMLRRHPERSARMSMEPPSARPRSPTIRPSSSISSVGLHHQMEARITPAARGKKIQKIPLRHQGDEFTGGRQGAEIRGVDGGIAKEAGEPVYWSRLLGVRLHRSW